MKKLWLLIVILFLPFNGFAAQQTINGTGSGETHGTARAKMNENFTEVYGHVNSTSNPHSVTATQAGAVPTGQGVPSGGTTGQVLKKQSATNYDVDWEDESGGGGTGDGDVVGPSSSVDDRIVTFDSTTGKLIQDSGVGIADVTANTAKVSCTTSNVDAAGAVMNTGNETIEGEKTFSDPTTFSDNVVIGAFAALTGDISPAQITANQNDYNPTGLSGASTLRLSSDASRDITGLQGGSDGRLLLLHNVGSNDLVLKDADSNSTAAYRFALTADFTLEADGVCLIQYDSTSSRWRLIGGGGGKAGEFSVESHGSQSGPTLSCSIATDKAHSLTHVGGLAITTTNWPSGKYAEAIYIIDYNSTYTLTVDGLSFPNLVDGWTTIKVSKIDGVSDVMGGIDNALSGGMN
jgi:hypothetical protein